MSSPLIVGALCAYIAMGRFLMRGLRGRVREILFAALNVLAVYFLLFHGQRDHFALRFCIHLTLVIGQFVLLRLFAERSGYQPWIAFAAPIAALVMFRYLPDSFYSAVGHAFGQSWSAAPTMVGISYLAFRSSYLVLEVRNRKIERPNFFAYLGYCFFLPTMQVGPISPYSVFRSGFTEQPREIHLGRASLRILIGLTKFQFLAPICNRLTYSGLLLDEHPHPWLDLPIAMVAYYVFLYLNFSGFCDMAIGAAGAMGIPVSENFANPMAARNMREFWNRWHITLSQYMRDVMFSPLSKSLTRAMGPDRVNHAVAIAISVVFLLVGIWHGFGWNFVAFGAAQAVGVVANHYYTLGLKRYLGRDRFKIYNSNSWIHAASVAITFCYFSASLIFFANTFPEIAQILRILR